MNFDFYNYDTKDLCQILFNWIAKVEKVVFKVTWQWWQTLTKWPTNPPKNVFSLCFCTTRWILLLFNLQSLQKSFWINKNLVGIITYCRILIKTKTVFVEQ